MASKLDGYGINLGIVPSGGWHYKQPWQDGFHVIGGPGWTPDLVVLHTTHFRIEQNLPMGDVALDVAEYIRSVSPQNDLRKRVAYDPMKTKARPIRPLVERAREWISFKRFKPVRLLTTTDEPRKRATRCANCAHNIREWHSSCEPCNEKLKHEGINLRQRAKYDMDAKLGVCRLYGMYVPAAIFLDKDELPERLENSPSLCWVQKPL